MMRGSVRRSGIEIPVRFGLSALLALSFLVGMAAGAGEAAGEPESALLQFIPAGTEYVIAFDVDALRRIPAVREALESDSEEDGDDEEETASGGSFFGDQLAAFEDQYQVKLADCHELLFAGGGRRLRGLLIEVEKPEKELVQSLRAIHGKSYERITVRNHPIHLLSDPTLASFGASKIGLSYLGSQTVLVTEEEYLAPFFDGLNASADSRHAGVIVPEGKPIAWGYFNVGTMIARRNKKQQQTDFLGVFFRDIRSIGAKLDYPGHADKEWRLVAIAQCADSKAAEQIQRSLPSYLMLAVNLLFAGDPELGMNLIKATNISVDGNRVTLDMEISAALATRLGDYLAAESDRRMIAPDPVPADLRRRPEQSKTVERP